MTAFRLLAIAVLLAAAPANAQVWQPRPGVAAQDAHRWQADRHRIEMDRLRAAADQRQALAEQLRLETRLNRLDIEAARRPEPAPAPAYRTLRSPEEERRLRESATARRHASDAGVGQIDAWLDRSRD